MDGHSCRSFFLEPQLTSHRRYEALRACFVEDRPVAEVAAQFGYKPTALQVMIRRFRAQFRRGQVPPFSSPTVADGHPANGAVKIATALSNPPSRTSAS
jgi:hypothetical protein